MYVHRSHVHVPDTKVDVLVPVAPLVLGAASPVADGPGESREINHVHLITDNEGVAVNFLDVGPLKIKICNLTHSKQVKQ